MTDNLIAAWALAAADDFGGSLYPTAAELSAMGETLQRDVCLWTATLTREYCTTYSAPIYTRSEDAPEPPALATRPRKPYQSNYIGVTRKYSGWRGQWPIAPGRYVCGPTRADELEAAHDRASALGLDYLEVRVMEERQ